MKKKKKKKKRMVGVVGKGWLGNAISLSEHKFTYSEKAKVIPSDKDYLSSVSCKSKSFLKCDNEQKNKTENMFYGHLLETPQCGTTYVFMKIFQKLRKISQSYPHILSSCIIYFAEPLTLLHSERSKLHRVLAVLSGVGLSACS